SAVWPLSGKPYTSRTFQSVFLALPSPSNFRANYEQLNPSEYPFVTSLMWQLRSLVYLGQGRVNKYPEPRAIVLILQGLPENRHGGFCFGTNLSQCTKSNNPGRFILFLVLKKPG